jgi:HK97 family phage portal protein
MDIAGGIKRIFNVKESRTARSIVQFFQGQAAWTPADYGSLAQNGYVNNVYVYSCVNIIAKAVGGLDWGVFKVDKKGEDVELDKHPLLDLLKKPNPFMGRGRFFESLTAYLMLAGNSYIESVGPKGSPMPKELWLLRPDRTRVIVGNAQEMVRGYEYQSGGLKVVIEPEAILHLRLFNPLDDFYGMSPLQAASRAMDQNNYSKEWNLALLQNSGRPSGAFISQTHLPDASFKRLQDQINSSMMDTPHSRVGYRNAGKPLLLETVDWKEMAIHPKDMDWLEGARMSAREIGVAFGVPSELMGDVATKTYASMQEARKGFYEETVLPLADWIQGELNAWLVGRYDDDSIKLAYDKDDVEALSEDRVSLWARVTAAPFLTVNEKRIACGYEETEDGDVILIPSSLKVLGEEPPAPVVVQSAAAPVVANSATTPTPQASSKPKALDIKLKCVPGFYETKAVMSDRHKKYLLDAQKKQNAWMNPITQQIEEALLNEADDAAEFLKAGKDPIVAIKPTLWKTILTGIFMSVGKDFAESAAAGAGIDTPPGDWWMEYVAGYIQQHGGEKIKQITSTSEGILRDILERGVREGLPIDAIAAEIKDNAFDLARRAEMIARTEIHNACQAGTAAFAKLGSLKTHTWLCANDELSRQWHKDVYTNPETKTVPINEPFIVMGEELMFPGDGSLGASAENIINCRCVEIYGEPLERKPK